MLLLMVVDRHRIVHDRDHGGAIIALGWLMAQTTRNGGSGGNSSRFTDNSLQSRTYGRSLGDIRGQANRWADRMRRRGYEVWVGGVKKADTVRMLVT